jgi:phage terminase large subunit-like protein
VRKNAKDEWMPDKGASPQKIDLAVAVLMAISECVFSDAEYANSVYDREKRGFLEIG